MHAVMKALTPSLKKASYSDTGVQRRFFAHQERLLTRCFGVRKPTCKEFVQDCSNEPPLKATTLGYVDLFHFLPGFFSPYETTG